MWDPTFWEFLTWEGVGIMQLWTTVLFLLGHISNILLKRTFAMKFVKGLQHFYSTLLVGESIIILMFMINHDPSAAVIKYTHSAFA